MLKAVRERDFDVALLALVIATAWTQAKLGAALRRGRRLEVIRARATHLRRFMENDARIACLPPPHKDPVDVPRLVARVVTLEQLVPVEIVSTIPCHAPADVSQLKQVLINLLENAAEAEAETGGSVRVG